MKDMTGEEQAALKKKYFPRVPWTENGPVRRLYRANTAAGDGAVLAALAALAEREGFNAPGEAAVIGGAADCLAAFRQKAAGGRIGMIFGAALAAHWCDIAAGEADADGWRTLIVRSEEGENLTALAHNEGLLRFRRAKETP